MSDRKQTLGKLALLGTALIWGTSFVVLKNTLDSMGALWLLTVRFSVSAVLLLAIAGKKVRRASKRCVKGGVILGLCLAVAYLFQTYGLVYTTPGKNAFLTATYCVLTPFLAWVIYRRKPGASNLIAAFLCIAGIFFVSLGSGLGAVNKGDMLTLVCGIFYAFQIIVLEQYRGSGDAMTISAIQFTAAAVFFLIAAVLFEQPPEFLPVSAWFSVAYLSIMCTAVCFFLQAWGMKYTSSSTAAMIMTLESVFGALISVLFYGEQVTPRMLLGFTLIFMAVLCSELRPIDRRANENT